MSSWRLLETWDAEPGFNMGLDETLLEGSGPPTLRFYTWRPDALSLGYFQSRADLGDRPSRAGAVVRRITGGGAIHHTGELTFSITVSRADPLYRGSVASSYERVHAVIAAALAETGLETGMRSDAALASDRAGTGMCFHHSTALDLVLDGRKLVGSAQRRKGARILHHGSIKLAPSPLEEGVATLAEAGRPLEARDLARGLARAFERALGVRLSRAEIDPAEREEALRRGARYLDPDFVHRR